MGSLGQERCGGDPAPERFLWRCDLFGMKFLDLRLLCRHHGVRGYSFMDKDDMVREILLARAVHCRLFDAVSGGACVVEPLDLRAPDGCSSLPAHGLGCFSLGGFRADVEPCVANLSVRAMLRRVVPEFDLEVVGFSKARCEVGVRYRCLERRRLCLALRSRRAELVACGVGLVAMDVEDPDVDLVFSCDKPRLASTLGRRR